MRILLTADPMIPVPPAGYGGIERIVDALVRHFRSNGHCVGLAAHPASTSTADERFGWPDPRPGAGLPMIRNALALRRSAGAFRPDILHSFSRLAYLAPLLCGRIPKVMSYQRHTGGRQIALAARLGGSTLRFTGCSEFICGMGRRSGGNWTSIHNFIEPEQFTFVGEVPPDAPLVFLSRIESIKGADLAIGMARAAGRRLILAGNHALGGPQFEYWARRIEPEIDRAGVEWAGEVDDARKNELLGRAAALIVPVQWDEPFGIVFPEALACGTPVLSCRRGALPEIIDEGRTGFFAETIEDGAAAIRRLGEISRAECRRVAVDRFSLAVCAARYLALYGSLGCE